jgi:CubicO group peptidase (beta-lactamase class C family)
MLNTQILTAPGQQIAHRAGGYKESSAGFSWTRLDTHIYGDGQLMTTPDDFALWDKSLYECKLLKKSSLDLAFKNTKLSTGKMSGYGFAWEISAIKGHKIVSHSGSWNGTSTFILRCPDTGLSVMVLSNDEDFGAAGAGEEIANLLLKNNG